MKRQRRVAAVMSTVAVLVFLLVLSTSGTTVSAAKCQEECNAEQAASLADCDNNWSADPVAHSACYQAVNQAWNSCSMNAVTCQLSYMCWMEWYCVYYNPSWECYFMDGGCYIA